MWRDKSAFSFMMRAKRFILINMAALVGSNRAPSHQRIVMSFTTAKWSVRSAGFEDESYTQALQRYTYFCSLSARGSAALCTCAAVTLINLSPSPPILGYLEQILSSKPRDRQPLHKQRFDGVQK